MIQATTDGVVNDSRVLEKYPDLVAWYPSLLLRAANVIR